MYIYVLVVSIMRILFFLSFRLVRVILWINLRQGRNQHIRKLVNQVYCLWLLCIWNLSFLLNVALRLIYPLQYKGQGQQLYLFDLLGINLGNIRHQQQLGKLQQLRLQMSLLICRWYQNFICFSLLYLQKRRFLQ